MSATKKFGATRREKAVAHRNMRRKIARWINKPGWVLAQGLDDVDLRKYVTSFIFLLIGLVILYFVGSADIGDAFDFCCFAFACLAGIVAGAGLFYGNDVKRRQSSVTYSQQSIAIDLGTPYPLLLVGVRESKLGVEKTKEKVCYSVSLVFLYFALLSYALCHDTCKGSSILVQIAVYVMVTARVVGSRLIKDKSRGLASFFVNCMLIILICGLVLVFFELPIRASDVFNFRTLQCFDQTKHL